MARLPVRGLFPRLAKDYKKCELIKLVKLDYLNLIEAINQGV